MAGIATGPLHHFLRNRILVEQECPKPAPRKHLAGMPDGRIATCQRHQTRKPVSNPAGSTILRTMN